MINFKYIGFPSTDSDFHVYFPFLNIIAYVGLLGLIIYKRNIER